MATLASFSKVGKTYLPSLSHVLGSCGCWFLTECIAVTNRPAKRSVPVSHGRIRRSSWSCGCSPDNKVLSPASGCRWVQLLKIKLNFNLKTEDALGQTVTTLLLVLPQDLPDFVLLSNHVSLTLHRLSRRVGPKDLVPSGFARVWNWLSWWQGVLEGKWENGRQCWFEKLQNFLQIRSFKLKP